MEMIKPTMCTSLGLQKLHDEIKCFWGSDEKQTDKIEYVHPVCPVWTTKFYLNPRQNLAALLILDEQGCQKSRAWKAKHNVMIIYIIHLVMKYLQ